MRRDDDGTMHDNRRWLYMRFPAPPSLAYAVEDAWLTMARTTREVQLRAWAEGTRVAAAAAGLDDDDVDELIELGLADGHAALLEAHDVGAVLS